MATGLEQEMWQVLAQTASLIGVEASRAELVSLHSNAIFAVPDAELVVRIATNPAAFDGAAASIRVTRWLSERGFRCTRPAGVADQPMATGGRAVTFWRLLATCKAPRPTVVDLAHLLRDLHGCGVPELLVPVMADPLASVAAAVAGASAGLNEADRHWLVGRIAALRRWWAAADFIRDPVLIHGDAHDNNLLRLTDGSVVLGDWDHVALGPIEWDLMQPHYTHRRFGRPDGVMLDAFGRAYGWDVRTWPGLETLITIRELSGLAPYLRTAVSRPHAAAEVAHRLTTLRAGDTHARWHPPQRR